MLPSKKVSPMRSLSTSSLTTLALIAALGLAACNNKDAGTGATVATVNGQAIKESQVTAQLAQIPANVLQGHEAEARKQIIDAIIQQDLLAQAADKAKVSSNQTYKDQLAASEKQLAVNELLAQKVSETITPAALQQAYDATKNQLAFPAVKAKHILVPTEQQALDIIKIASPANFDQMAKQYSKGPSAENGGELGWFRREAMIPEFATVAFNTPVNTVAKQPVKTQFGWHVILVEDRQQSYVPPLDQVSQQLKNQLAQTVVQGYMQDLRKNAKVEYTDAAGISPTTPAAIAPAAGK